MSITDNFMKGANFVRQHEIDAENRQLANQQNQRAQERHQATLAGMKAHQSMNAERQAEWRSNRQNRATLADIQIDNAKSRQEDHAYRRDRRQVVDKRQDEEYAHNKTRRGVTEQREDTAWAWQVEEKNKKDNLTWLQGNVEQEMFRLKKDGTLSPEFYERMKDTPFDISRIVDEKYGQKLDFLASAINPKDGRASPKDPRFLAAFNDVFAEQINKNMQGSTHPKTGSPAVKKEIVNVRPVEGEPGQWYAEMMVTYQDGSTLEAPMTKGRGSEDDAELSTVGTGDLVQQISARKAYKDMVEQSGIKERYVEFEKAQAAKAKAKDAKPNYDQLVSWKGQTVKATELADQFEMLGDELTKPTMDGQSPLIPFEHYLWTGGDPEKMNVMMQIAEENRRIDAANMQADEDEQVLRIDPREAWAAEMERRAKDQKPDPNAGTLNDMTDNDAPDRPKQPYRHSAVPYNPGHTPGHYEGGAR